MLVSYKWLQEYVDVPWAPEALAERLTMSGLEVEGLEPLAADLSEVYVGFVRAAKQHPPMRIISPFARLKWASGGSYTIVCGAPNVAAGQKVPVALPGARLPGGMEISAVEIRGIASAGMICSEVELGLGEDGAGIWVLPEELEAGTPLATALDLDDVILDVSIYANRLIA